MPAPTKWRVDFVATASRALVASFDCEISRVSRYVSPKVGEIDLTIPVVNDAIGNQARKVWAGEGWMSLYVYRNGAPWGWGFLDEVTVDSGDLYPVMRCSGSGFEDYPNRRELRGDVKTSMEQTAFAKWCWDYMQGTPGGNLHIATPTQKASGISKKLEWLRSDVKTVGSVLKEVSNAADGFEWLIDCHMEDGRPALTLKTGYPFIGRPAYGTVLTYPGNIITYSLDGTALDGAVSFQARGKAPENVGKNKDAKTYPIMSQAYTNSALLNRGYTITDATIDRSNETSQAKIEAWAKLARELRSGPLKLPSVTVRMDAFNASILGSTVRLRIKDFLWPKGPNGAPGYTMTARVIGYEIDPGENGADDVVKLIFENPQDADGIALTPQ